MGRFAMIGHSNRPQAAVIDMLRDAGIRLLVDVRSFPKSRSNPAFNDDTFGKVLADHQIGYRHMLALGGRRPKQPEIDESTNALWRVRSFHNYADYTLGPVFHDALHELIQLGRDQPLAMMCSEAVWWRCHRRIITDYLLLNGYEVTHLMAAGRMEAARPTPDAKCAAATGWNYRLSAALILLRRAGERARYYAPIIADCDYLVGHVGQGCFGRGLRILRPSVSRLPPEREAGLRPPRS